MKAILEYDLPEEMDQYELAMNGAKLSCQLDDYDNALRAIVKYDSFENIKDFLKTEYPEIEFNEEQTHVIVAYCRNLLYKARNDEL